ncbi:MAG: fatty acid desaturase, partial [Gemmataceae bacterium]
MTHIEKQTLRDLHSPGWAGTFLTLSYTAAFLIVAALSIVAVLAEAYLWLVPLVLIQTYIMHALLIAFHEAAHGGLCPWWPLNEYLARAIGGFACISVTLYRIVHQWHHAYLGTPRDEEFWPFTDPLAPRSTRLLAAGSELTLGLIHTPLIFLRA